MSEEAENGNGNRATIALVYRTVDDLHKLVDAHFETINAKLDAFADHPRRLEALERTALDHERRLLAAEREREAREAGWAVHWPTVIVAFFVVAMGFVGQLLFH